MSGVKPRPRRARALPQRVAITLSEHDGIRFLHFGSPWVQGAMLLDAPEAIVIDYVARMMGWQLFLESPRRILQLGLGAGALTRYTRARVPGAQVTVVECSADVIATARHWFALPREGRMLRVVHADAAEFLAQQRNALGKGEGEGEGYAVVQVDLYDTRARGPVLESVAFYR
ncbi:MAG: spermidine synthase, partial [Burkholderiaceae bacterium]|nr:spermidine synthase [Burkholderiaceae bacterium]